MIFTFGPYLRDWDKMLTSLCFQMKAFNKYTAQAETKDGIGFVPTLMKKKKKGAEDSDAEEAKASTKKKRVGGTSFRREQWPMPMLLQLLKNYGRASEIMVHPTTYYCNLSFLMCRVLASWSTRSPAPTL